MGTDEGTVAPDADTTGQRRWAATHQRLTAEAADRPLTAAELDTMAEALFWMDRIDDSIEARRAAYRAHVDDGDDAAATLSAWRLFYEHWLVGEAAVARGWLERGRRHVVDGSPSAGWLALADVDVAAADGDDDRGLALAREARALGQQHDERDLMAMALQSEGRALVRLGRAQEGLSRLDEAMVAVINDEIQPLFTGWIYCNVVSSCFDLADLRRANEWSEAAMRWCSSLREGLLYPGLCRIYSSELAYLRGAWGEAERKARRACAQLLAHDARYAAGAFYVVAELHRLRGETDQAVAAFVRGHELGRPPQPGLALLRLAEGRVDEAVAALRASPPPSPAWPLPRALFLLALLDAAIEAGDDRLIDETVEALETTAATVEVGLLPAALALVGRGMVTLHRGDPATAVGHLRDGVEQLDQIDLPHEAARRRLLIAEAAGRLGDQSTAQVEARAALATFERLGAEPDRIAAARLLDRLGADPDPAGSPAGSAPSAPPAAPATSTKLSNRELQVLRLVAEGHTNAGIAETLVLSPHTVARHVSNILTKLGVPSRAAATGLAYERGLFATGDGPSTAAP